jgi:Ca2+-binding RTX toxin-like protein
MTTLWGDASDNVITNLSSDAESDLYGMDGNDTLTGNAGVDYIFGQKGDDIIFGGAGNDWLYGGQGADRLSGGRGIDTVSYYDAYQVNVALDGSFGNTGDAAGDVFEDIENLVGSFYRADKLAGNGLANRIWGLGGDDVILGRGGNDSLSGEGGNDEMSGENGDDWLFGGQGADALDGGLGRDGASYRDSVGINVSLDGSLAATGEARGDTFASIENLDGSQLGRDVLVGNAAANSIWGHGGNDDLYGQAGSDKLFGGMGRDILQGGLGNDVLAGDLGADALDGGTGSDTASYRASAGVAVSLNGSVSATGAALGDTFDSIENLSGSEHGNDVLSGDAEDNALWGNGGSDILLGRAGSDFLFGGAGLDRLIGGEGDDYFVFEMPGQGVDTITDFEDGDLIELTGSSFGLASGFLATGMFQSQSGHVANSAAIRLMFDEDTHVLWFDRDGNGATDAIRLAVFSNNFALGAGEIYVT